VGFPAIFPSTETSTLDPSSGATHGPPNGQPVPVAMSTPMSRRAASRDVCSSTSIHRGDRNGMSRGSEPRAPKIGVISTPPMPAFAIASSCALSCFGSTALPGHHHRVHGLAVRVIAGHVPSAAAASSAAARAAPVTATIVMVSVIHAFIGTPCGGQSAAISTRFPSGSRTTHS
jgi:hypothetical protein